MNLWKSRVLLNGILFNQIGLEALTVVHGCVLLSEISAGGWVRTRWLWLHISNSRNNILICSLLMVQMEPRQFIQLCPSRTPIHRGARSHSNIGGLSHSKTCATCWSNKQTLSAEFDAFILFLGKSGCQSFHSISGYAIVLLFRILLNKNLSHCLI